MALYILRIPPQTPPTQDRIYRAFLSGRASLAQMLEASKKKWDFQFSYQES
jgi:hypothetical protein